MDELMYVLSFVAAVCSDVVWKFVELWLDSIRFMIFVFDNISFANCSVLVVKVLSYNYETSGWSKFRKFSLGYRCKPGDYGQEGTPGSHSHPKAQLLRDSIISHLRESMLSNGFKMYDPSTSGARRDRGVSAFDSSHRYVFSVQDIAKCKVGGFNKTYHSDRVVTLIDQDFHYGSLSQYAGNPIVAYSVNTDKLSGKGVDSSWYYESCDSLVEVVSGGAKYRQHLWDYSGDIVCIGSSWGWNFTIYNVHHVLVPDTHRDIVFLSPKATVMLNHAWFSAMMKWFNTSEFHLPMLGRRNNVVRRGDVLCGKFGTVEKPYYSLKFSDSVGPESSAEISENVYNFLEHQVKAHITVHAFSRELKQLGETLENTKLAVLTEYFSLLGARPMINIVYHSVLPNGEMYKSEARGKVTVEPITTSVGVTHDTVAPQAMDSYVLDRVAPYVNNKDRLSDEKRRLINIFVSLIVDEFNLRNSQPIVPLDVVIEEQSRPAQKARNAKTLSSLPDDDESKYRTFLKKEVLHKAQPARGINQASGNHSITSGQVARSLGVVLKTTSWYMIGKTYDEISQEVMELSGRCVAFDRRRAEGDFTRMDETVGNDKRHLIKRLCEEVFMEQVIRTVHKTLDNDCGKTLRGGDQIVDIHNKNMSGSGLTSVINSVSNMFTLFECFIDLGLSPVEAYNVNCLIYGDDSLFILPSTPKGMTDSQVLEKMTATAAASGMIFKLESVVHPEHSCLFLGRTYPAPLISPTSALAITKSLMKLPCAVDGKIETSIAKFQGYYVTEQHVPVVGDYIRALARIYKFDLKMLKDRKSKSFTALLKTLSETDKNMMYRVLGGVIPYDATRDSVYLNSLVMLELKLTQTELKRTVDALCKARTESDLVKIKIWTPEIEAPLGAYLA